MKSSILQATATLIFIALSSPIFGQNTVSGTIEGNWLGVIESNGIKLRLVLKVSKASDGSYAAKLDSIDQGASDLAIDKITQQNRAVNFEAKQYFLSFDGTLNEKGDEITGQLKQGGATLPLTFKYITEVPKISRPQEPQKPYPYNEEEVSYENKKDGVKLAGTLTLPRSARQQPAVILITGSGGQDRNETIAGHRPFLVLADYLTRSGIAVLRVDDRGIGGSSPGPPTATSENYAEDVVAGIEYLKSRKEIDAKQIGLVGHSEGGMIAPLVAARSKDVAFIVLLAGLGQTGVDVIYTQTVLIQAAEGTSQDITTRTVTLLKKIFAILKAEPDNKLAEQRIRETLTKQMSEMSEEQRKSFAEVEMTIKTQIPMYLSAWFRYFIAYDPRLTLGKVNVPVLAINGENDLQVSAKENLNLIAAGLRAGGNKDVTTISFPKLNHLLQTSKKGLPSEYDEIEETMSPVVLQTISSWILKRVHAK